MEFKQSQQKFDTTVHENGYSMADTGLFEKAITYAKNSLGEMKRYNGESQFTHNLRIGVILADAKAFPEVVAAGLLKHVNKQVLPSELQGEFGQEIADLVFGQQQLAGLKNKNEHLEAEALRQILLVSIKDPRIIFVKLASKLDNLKHMDAFSTREKQRISKEVLDIYGPLAGRLGMNKLKAELEEEAFKILNPRRYKEISDYLNQSKQERETTIKNFVDEVKGLLEDKIELVTIKGRPKHIYSIYRKFKRTRLDKQYDHFAIRIITRREHDCYVALGYLLEHFTSIKKRLKDYIQHPKSNGYQSIHTIVRYGDYNIEVQIRTQEMDEVAEEGIAAHWSYKKLKSDPHFEMKTAWLRSLLDLQQGTKSKEFLKTAKVDLFGDRIYCYTPKGDVINLPKKACVLDFAYHIHQKMGDTSIGGRINGRFAPLKTKLSQGDVVEIVTNKNQRPRRDWLKLVASAKAKQKIRQGLRKTDSLPVIKYKKKSLSEEEQKYEDLVNCKELPTVHCTLARCCHPLPQDEIVGILTKRQEISVHKSECKEIRKLSHEYLHVGWKESFNRPLQVVVQAASRSGVLVELLNTILQAGFSVKEAKGKVQGQEISICSFSIAPRPLEDVTSLVEKLHNVRGVKKIRFT
ncbi:MAG: RelA/SpoT family protein [Candidatus Woesearchaeota archaeon]